MKSVIGLWGGMLLWAGCVQEVELPAEVTAVSFSLSGIDTGVATRGENLAAGTTVRVVAYKGTSYVADNTYTADGKGGLTSTGEMRLIDDTYDFYAISPALAIASKTTGGPTYSVAQGVDVAAVKVTQRVTAYSGSSSSTKCTIALGELARKCSKLTFDIAPGSDIPVTVSSLVVTGVTLTGLPATLTATGATLPAGSGNATLTIPAAAFTTNGNKVSGSTIVLPKTNGTFTMSMDVRFNGSTVSVTFPTTTVSAMTFDPGKNHVLTIRLMKDRVGIWALVSSSWTDNSWADSSLGDLFLDSAPSGSWTGGDWGDSSLGGSNLDSSGSGSWTGSNQSGDWGGASSGNITGDLNDSWTGSNQSGDWGGDSSGSVTGGLDDSWTDITYNPGLGSSDADRNK